MSRRFGNCWVMRFSKLVTFACRLERAMTQCASSKPTFIDSTCCMLLTDVVMPGGVSGFQLADHFQSLYPGSRVLVMSGKVDPQQAAVVGARQVSFVAKASADQPTIRGYPRGVRQTGLRCH